jgi:hypothetical protein
MVATLFVWTWGLAYGREPLPERHPELAPEATPEESRRLVLEATAEANRLHRDHAPPPEDASIENAAALGLTRALGAFDTFSRPLGPPPKRLHLLGPLLDAWQVSGFCSPWTLEVHLNPSIPVWQRPFVLAHELAHQAGYPDETEASFLAYLACLASGDRVAAYSAQLSIVLLLESRGHLDPPEIEALLDDGPRRDREEARAWRRTREGFASRLFRRGYDLFLRAEGTEAGILAYSRVVDFVARYRAEEEER